MDQPALSTALGMVITIQAMTIWAIAIVYRPKDKMDPPAFSTALGMAITT